MTATQEFKLDNYTITFTPVLMTAVNLPTPTTDYIKIEVTHKKRLRQARTIYSKKYTPSPALTIGSFLSRLTEHREKIA